MATRMQQRRGTAAQWSGANPILAAGEIGFETDTGKFKLGNGSSTWSSLNYFVDGATLIDGAPALLDTLNELAAAVGDDPAFFTTVATNLSNHQADTTNIHGIVDTSLLATTTDVTNHNNDTTGVHGINDTSLLALVTDVSTAQTAAEGFATAAISTHNSDTTQVHGIANTASLALLTDVSTAQTAAEGFATAAISTHNSDTTQVHGIANTADLTTTTAVNTLISNHNAVTTNVHGIADTADLILTSDSRLSDTRTPTDNTVTTAKIANSAVTADKIAGDAVTESKLADGAVTSGKIADGTIVNSDINASAAIAQSKIDGLSDSFDLKANLASPTFTGTVVLPTVTAGGSIVPSVDNTYDLGSPTAMWKDLYVGPGSLYVNGQKVLQDESGNIVVSADADENISIRTSGSGNVELDPTGTGSVNIKGHLVVEAGANFSSADGSGITFSNGINSDTIASKTLNTDLSLSGNGTGKVYLNDNAEVNGNLIVGGNLTVSGTTTTVNSETISLADNIIDLNSNFTTGTPTENSGLRVMRGDSNAVQVRWNESTDKWEFTNDGTNYSVIPPTDSPTFTGTVTIPSGASISGFAPLASPTFTGTVTVAANGIAFTDGTQTKEGVPSRTTINSVTDTYNLSTGGLTLRDSLIECNKATGFTVTIPANSTTAFPVGTSIDILQVGAGQVTIAGAAGVTVNATPGLKLRAQWSSATLFKRATDTWIVMGDLSA